MKTWDNSLRCLSHPVTLFSVVLLIFNDHFLKSAYPSWLTGKLSDFAGLFFFPFLVAAGLSMLSSRVRFSARTIGLMAFSATGIWFALMKTTDWGNTLTQDFLSRLLGFSIRIVLDPTDIIALVALLPAWVLWNRPMKPSRSNALGWVALVVATLASVATSPTPPPPFVLNVSSAGNTLCVKSRDNATFYESTDGGDSWSLVSRTLCEFPQPTLPKIVCSPSNNQLCYRVNKNELVEKSLNGGETFRVAWSVPLGRRKFMEQYSCGLFECLGKKIDMGPYDIAFAKYKDAEVVIAAMGNEGVLVLDQSGYWNRRGVAGATPTPFDSFDPLLALRMTGSEVVVLGIATFSAFPILSILSWVIIVFRLMRDDARARLPGAFVPAIGMMLIGVALYWLYTLEPIKGMIQVITKDENIALIYYGVILIVLPSLFLTGFMLSWHRISKIIAKPKEVGKALGLIFATAILIFPLGWAPVYGWVMGEPAVYENALVMSIGSEVVLLIVFLFLVAKLGWSPTKAT